VNRAARAFAAPSITRGDARTAPGLSADGRRTASRLDPAVDARMRGRSHPANAGLIDALPAVSKHVATDPPA